MGGDNSGRKKQKRAVNPCVAMVLSDKDMWSGIQVSKPNHLEQRYTRDEQTDKVEPSSL